VCLQGPETDSPNPAEEVKLALELIRRTYVIFNNNRSYRISKELTFWLSNPSLLIKGEDAIFEECFGGIG